MNALISKEVFTYQRIYFIVYVKIYLHFEGGFIVKVVNHIREIREKRGITQIKMAEDLQVTRQTVSAIEKNKYNPSLELALKLIAYFDVPIEELFYLKEEE